MCVRMVIPKRRRLDLSLNLSYCCVFLLEHPLYYVVNIEIFLFLHRMAP
jgi:hypothetical protein